MGIIDPIQRIFLSTWPHHKGPYWPKQMETSSCNQPRCPTNTGHTSKHTHSSVWSSIHHQATTGQKTMGNEAWLILLAQGYKQSVGNQRRRKNNPSGPTSCCMTWSSSLQQGKTLHSGTHFQYKRSLTGHYAVHRFIWQGSSFWSYLLSVTLVPISLPQSFSHSFFPFLSSLLCCGLVCGERPGTKLSRWGTLMGQSWLSGLSAYMHAMQTMRPLSEQPASPS